MGLNGHFGALQDQIDTVNAGIASLQNQSAASERVKNTGVHASRRSESTRTEDLCRAMHSPAAL